MGVWGPGPFEDDTAMDFVDDLIDGPAEQVMPKLLATLGRQDSAESAQDYVLSVNATAAAALIAGYTTNVLDEDEVREWVTDTIPPLTPEHARLALDALENAHSEQAVLPELWADAGRWDDRRAAIAPLRLLLHAALPVQT